ncbi:hypothetical protein OIO90_003584 [Microbotryomycetes sp. JL221]|nr:hypothetical protein OIO90_003584 [Microbotryomycetes sp. JL221]
MAAKPTGMTVPTTTDQDQRKRGYPNWTESIERGKACLQCRTKKLRCDGQRPMCSACIKRRRHTTVKQEDQAQANECTYEDRDPNEKVRRVSRKQIQTLEDKIEALELELSRLGNSSIMNKVYPTPTRPSLPPPQPPSNLGVSAGPSPSGSTSIQSPASTSMHSSTPSTSFASDHKSPSAYDVKPVTSTATLLATGYSPNLPPPPTVKRIVDLYLTSKHPCTSMFDVSMMRARLSNQPTHPEYPHAALLHAMIALEVDLHGEQVLGDHPLPAAAESAGDSVAHWHAMQARTAADRGAHSCDRFFDIVQAVTLLSIYSYRICRFQDIWHLTGLGARIAVALRLNKVPVFSQDWKWEYCAYTNAPIDVVRLPRNVKEVTDRRMAFWWTYVGERFAAANTGWAMMIQDDDIGTLLPSATPDRPDAPDDWKHMLLSSPDFFLSHPPHLIGGLQLFFKATVLLGRASMHSRKLPRFNDGCNIANSSEQARSNPNFTTFERNLGEYIRSTAAFVAANSDNDYTPFVAAMPHIARILAHEPLCGSSLSDLSLVLCTDAARRVLASLGHKLDAGVAAELLPFLTFCWTIAGRALIRQIAIYRAKDMEAGASQIKQEVDVLMQRLRLFKNPNTENGVTVLSGLLTNPAVLLPSDMVNARPMMPSSTMKPSPASSQASPPDSIPTPVSNASPLPQQAHKLGQDFSALQASVSISALPATSARMSPSRPPSSSNGRPLSKPSMHHHAPMQMYQQGADPYGSASRPDPYLANFPLGPTAPSSLAASRRWQQHDIFDTRASSAPTSPQQHDRGRMRRSPQYDIDSDLGHHPLLDPPVPSSSHLLTDMEYAMQPSPGEGQNYGSSHASTLPTPPTPAHHLPTHPSLGPPPPMPIRYPVTSAQSFGGTTSHSYVAPTTTAAMAAMTAAAGPVMSLEETKQRLAQLHAEENVRRLDVAVGMGSGIGTLCGRAGLWSTDLQK